MNAEEQENQAHQVITKEAHPTPQLDPRWTKMHCYENDEKWERIRELRGCYLEQEEQRNSWRKDPKTLQETAREDPRTLQETARERTRGP